MTKLTDLEIQDRMPGVKGWERHGDMLVKTWQFSTFRRAIEFLNQVADQIEKADHYPDLTVGYRSVRIEMSTHDAGGLTEQDFVLIAAIDEISTDR